MTVTLRSIFFSALALALCNMANAAHIYTIVQNQSQLNLTVTGSVLGGQLTVTEQNASAITRYNGTIAASFPGGPAANGSISFPTGGTANAVNPPGNFTPNVNGAAGSAAGNYGVNLNAPLDQPIDLPAFEYDGNMIDIGTITAINAKVAIRNLVLDVSSAGPLGITPGKTFDANGTSLSIVGGFADITAAVVLNQPDFITKLAVQLALSTLASQQPDLGITVTSPGLLSTEVHVGIGTRVDLSTIGNTAVANGALTDGSVSYALPSGVSTLVLPVTMDIASLGDLDAFLDLNLNLSGQFVATAVVSEPSSIILAATGLLGLGMMARRRFAKS